MDRERCSLHELVVQMRNCAALDVEFAQIVALSCVTIADRERKAERDGGQALRAYFQLQ